MGMFFAISFNLCFVFSDNRSIDDLGFGTIFDGVNFGGQLANISTQAVFDMMRNIKIPGEETESSFIEMAALDMDEFNIPRTVSASSELSTSHGNLYNVYNDLLKAFVCSFACLNMIILSML